MSIRDAVLGLLYLVMIAGVIGMALMGIGELVSKRFRR